MSTSTASNSIDLHWKWWEAQRKTREVIRSGNYDLVVMRTGYGGGKTKLLCREVIEWALEIPRSDNLLMAPDFQKGGPATYKAFFDELPGEDTVPDEGGDPENSPIVIDYNDNKKRVTFITKSVARLGSADKWNRYAGTEFNFIGCDEPAHYDNTDLYDLHEMLISRQRTESGPNVTLWTSTGAGFNQFYDITERRVNPDDDPLTWGDSMEVIVASSLDNPFLEEKDKLVRSFGGTERAKQALHGGFAAPEGLVYSQFSRQDHVVPETEAFNFIQEDATPIYGYDAGWDHPRVLIEWYPTHYNQWVATDCYYETEKPFEHLCDPSDRSGWIFEQEKPKAPIYCEHEPEHIQKFRQAGYPATEAEKSLDEGIPYVRGLLEVKGDPERPGLLVSDKCVELIQEFQSYKEEDVGKSGDVPDHCLDASRYALFSHGGRPKRRKPDPEDSGVTGI